MSINRDKLQESLNPALRVRPRVGWGVLTYFLYSAVFYAIFLLNGIDYTRVGESERTLLLWYIAPLSGGAVLTITMVTIYGWWRPSLVERRRLSRWTMTLPIFMMVIAIVNMLTGDFTRVTPLMWLYLIFGSIMVGFNEEMINRGQLIVALRSRFGETGVWLLSTAMFAVFHLPNMFWGIGAGALFQVMVAFGLGSIFYLARRSTGSLVASIFLHGFWDLSVFSANGASALPIAGILAPLLVIAAVITVPIILRREKRRDTAQSVSRPVG
ncbi:CPBP family intramembrane metalloprotease [Paenibacillus sp. F6_3S_P_1C]|uniref:CPBP family intramembrane metalloprotease n=1 Tax=Paenibacillus vandeheii TaxID=3035917 RepID=A0ABT8JEB7_9BACL|nr:CPBP family intramembrane glutamic endopeptidase [Paenibacillus vandeheii]MDN4603337.1 CPBP family intramembrane metalloprotease [Paenibacillus vandeheii]